MIKIEQLNIYVYSPGEQVLSVLSKEFENCLKAAYDCHAKTPTPDGVYIMDQKGSCWKKEEYMKIEPALRPAAQGVVIIRGEHKLVVHPRGSGKDIILLEDGKTLPGDKYEDLDDGLQDYNGSGNTDKLAVSGSPAALYCRNLGSEWYLPSLGEMQLMYEHKKELDECLSVIGGKLYAGWHWMSTRRYDRSNFVFDWGDGDRDDYNQYLSYRVRPVCAFL